MVFDIKNVLLVGDISDQCVEILRSHNINTKKFGFITEQKLVSVIPDYDAIFVSFSTKVTRDVLIAAKNLKVIVCVSSYSGNIDKSAAENFGVGVINAPSGDIVSVSEYTCCLALALAKRMIKSWHNYMPMVWHNSLYRGTELNFRRIGLIGFGQLARQVVKQLKIFSTVLMVHDPDITPDECKEYSAIWMELNSMLAAADYIIFFSKPFETRSIYIDAQMMAAFKNGVKLIIVGSIDSFDMNAMWDAMMKGQIGSVAFDLYDEDLSTLKQPIFQHPYAISSMHLGAQTEEAVKMNSQEAAEQLVNLCYPGTYNTALSIVVNFPDNSVTQ